MLSDVVAAQIGRWRRQRGMSREQLAESCQDRGLPMTASVVANIETGRRDANGVRRREVSVDELAVFAEALELSPLRLLVPLESVDQFDVLPGRAVSTVDVVRWIRGEAPLPGQMWDGRGDGDSAIASFVVHQQCVDRWNGRRANADAIRSGARSGSEQDAEHEDREAERARSELRETRRVMRFRGLVLPALPGSLDGLDEEPAS